MSKFTVWSETVGEVSIVHLRGVLDAGSAISLAQTMESLLATDKHRLVLEVRQLWELDQEGLQVLLSGQSQAQEKQGDVRLAQPSARFAELLEIPELKERFQSFPTVEAAVGSFQEKKKKPRKIQLPIPMKSEIGLGDLIKRLTTAIGIKPCGGCEQRAEKLNQMVTIGGRQSSPSQHTAELPDS